MRLRRLDLTRYGCFTDFAVDFGERDPSKPDLHVIYGPNESGKSTLLAAFLDLIFGIEKRSSYDFLHDYRSMRIGVRLEISGRTHNLARIKRDSESLLGPGDQPVPETMLNSALGSINRASYTTMFSLDEDTFQSGGESILQSRGDLGRLLFSAASGLSELSRQLDEIKKNADAFHRPGGRATKLKQFKNQLADLKSRQGELDTNARRYSELLDKVALARTTYETAKIERDQTRVRQNLLRRLLDALPMWANLKALRDQLEPLQGLPDPPAGWAEEAQQLSQDEASRKAEIKGAEEDLVRLAGDLGRIVVDRTILGLHERIDRLKEEEGRYRTAIDIPVRENERRGVNEQIEGLIKRLGRPANDDPAALPLPVATVGALSSLIEARSGLVVHRDTARRERATASDRVGQAKRMVEEFSVAADVTALEVILTRVRAEENGARLGHAQKRHAEITAEIDGELIGLKSWQGDLEALAVLVSPERGRIEFWQNRLAVVREEQATISRRRGELVEERSRLTAEITVVKESTGVVDDKQAAAARSARDQAWQAHRVQLIATTADTDPIEEMDLRSTADAFEIAMSEDDRLADLRARQSADIARLRHAEVGIARTEASLAHVEENLEAARARLTGLTAEIADALRSIGLPGDMEPADLERWLERRDTVLKKRADLRKIETELRRANDAAAEARTQLTEAMAAVGAAPDRSLRLPQLLDLAQGVIDRAKERVATIGAARKALQDDELELQRRERDVAEAEQAVLAWQEEWADLVDGCWLGEAEAGRSPAEVREILQALSELPALIEKRDDLGYRIRSMSDDRVRFVATVRALAGEANLELKEEKELEVADDLRRHLATARQQTKLRDSKNADLEHTKTRLRKAQQVFAQIDSRRSEMGALFAVDTSTALLQKLEQAKEKASLTQQIATRERELVDGLKLPSLAAAETAIAEAASDEASIEALHVESVELASRLEAEDGRVTHLYHESMTAEAAIAEVGSDAEVARLEEERRTVLLEIQDQAERHLRLKVGVAAAERALQIYRDRHRSSMMTRAGEAFRTITQDRFSNLTTTPGKDGEVLVGIQSTGGSLIASKMSKGTRFQLYLALRIAGYYEFAEHHETLPFVADDIMESFDDDRSTEAFQLLSGIAQKGQVIYLTHHPHMRDIARKVCGKAVRLHELPAPMIGAAADVAAEG